MATKEMTLHELLVEIKMTKKKIDARLTMGGTAFVTTTTPGYSATHKEDVETVEKTLRANYQGISALISNLTEYERVRAYTNATTKLKVGDNEMTISDAIKFKDTIAVKKDLLTKLKDEYSMATRTCTAENNRLESRLDKVYPISTDATPEAIAAMQTVRESEKAKCETILLDPIKIDEVIKSLENEIDEFESQIDSALSYINAVTTVTVTLAD